MNSSADSVLTRRALLAGGLAAGVGAAGLLSACTSADPVRSASPESPAFRHGVASGDPHPDRVIIWTRVTVSEAARPGSGVGDPVSVRWEVASDASFSQTVVAGTSTAATDADHTVKVDVTGLAAARTYFYRFTALDGVVRDRVSPTGTTRTAPDLDADVARIRFGVVSCAHWEAGYFSAYRHLGNRVDLDAIVHLGDYLYEYERGHDDLGLGSARLHDPAHEIVTVADYRVRHGQYKTDPDLIALHARLPFICTWDDHEFANDAYAEGAQNHTPAVEGDWQSRRSAALQAYFEWMPVRATGSGLEARLYRRLRFGKLAEMSMLDLRSYRSKQVRPDVGLPGVDSADRTITGRAQLDWLTGGLATSDARWQVIGNSVMIAPLVFPPRVTDLLGIPPTGGPANPDQWDGYGADRRRLFDTITSEGVDNVIFLTGDIHSSWASDLPGDGANDPGGATVGAEFVVPAVSSPSFATILRMRPGTAPVIADAIQAANGYFRFIELESHGYGVLEIAREAAQMDWFFVTDTADPNTDVRHAVSFAVRDSVGRLEPRTAPLPK